MRLKGSITVFAALSMLLAASFLFVLLEGARVQGLNACADLVSEIGVNSVFAEYQSPFWEDYRLLFLDGAYGGEDFSAEKIAQVLCQRVSENLDLKQTSGISMYPLSLRNAEVLEYQLATDGGGSVFLSCIAAYMKNNLTREAAEEIYQKYQDGKEVEQNDENEYSVEAADTMLKEQIKAQEEKKEEDPEGEESSGETAPGPPAAEESGGETVPDPPAAQEEPRQNPLEIVLELKENAVLGMVAGDVSALSEKEINAQETILKRDLEKGTKAAAKTIDWYERVLIAEYIEKYFSNYRNPKETGALSYELEYLLCGGHTDKSNLEGTVNRLLWLREAANVAYIIKDRGKRNEAWLLAELLAGFTGNPVIIKVVQCGIVAAWAYVESLLDVRALLRGDKIALIKNGAQWTADTEDLLEAISNGGKAKNCENGLTYEEYLKQFLFAMEAKKLACRTMDMMEQSVRKIEGYEQIRMDHMVCELSCSIEYQAAPLFGRLSVIGKRFPEELQFQKTRDFSYLE